MITDKKIAKTVEKNPKGTSWKITWEDGKKDNTNNPDWVIMVEQSIKNHQPIQFTKEKEGDWWIIKTFQLVNDSPLVKAALGMGAEKVVQPTPQAPQSIFKPVIPLSNSSIPSQINGAEKGMVMKEISTLFIAGQLENMFTGTDLRDVQVWYRKNVLNVVKNS
jgi:hypothetical protein